MPSYPASRPAAATDESPIQSLLKVDGRWLVVLMVIGYFTLLTTTASLLNVDIGNLWNTWGVPAMTKHFIDLQCIAAGVEKFKAADYSWNPDVIASCVAASSYPRWWLCAAFLGFDQDTYYSYGYGIILLFFASALYVLGRINLVEGFVAGLVLISPAIMTGIERGNGDLFIFSILALAFGLRRSMPLATLCITTAAFLKLYPAAVLVGVTAPPWRKSLPWLAGALAVFGLNLLTSLNDLHQVSNGIFHMQWFSFGTTTLLLSLQMNYPKEFNYTELLLMGSVMMAVVVVLSIRMRPLIEIKPGWEGALYAFRIGASIFIGTFALGTNYDYRTMILVFCLPLIFILIREKGPACKWAVTLAFLIVLYTGWRSLFLDQYDFHFFIKQAVAWSILVCLTAIYAAIFRWSTKTATAIPLANAPEKIESDKK